MKFKQRWSNSAELDFSNSGKSVVDITASTTIEKYSSSALLIQVGKWNANADVNFSAPWSADASLEFAIDSGVRPPITIDIQASATLYPPQARCDVVSITSIEASTTTQALNSLCALGSIASIEAVAINEAHSSTCDIGFDINVWRGVEKTTAVPQQRASQLQATTTDNFADSPSLQQQVLQQQINATALQNSVLQVHFEMPVMSKQLTVPTRNGDKRATSISHVRHRMGNIHNAIHTLFAESDHVSRQVSSHYLYPPRADNAVAQQWQNAEALARQWSDTFADGLPIVKTWSDAFENAINPVGYRPTIVIPPKIIPEQSADLDFKALWSNDADLDFLRIELDALIVMNKVRVNHVALDGTKTQIHPKATFLTDIDSFIYSVSGTLFGKSNLEFLTPKAKFEIEINGHFINLELRGFSEESSFGETIYSFVMVTPSQWLHSPHASLHTGTVTAPIGAWQLAEEKLQTEGFTLNRMQSPEWVLSPDSFSYINQSPIELVKQVAAACGAIVKPDLMTKTIHIQPRYKTSPWDMAALTDEQCDHVIDADYVTASSIKDNSSPEINDVWISATRKGVSSEIVKAGTAGDVRSKDIITPLSQDQSVNAELARNVMGDSGQQKVQGIITPLLSPDSAFGLVLSGDIVRIKHPERDVTGLCINNSIDMQTFPAIRQDIKLEVNHGYS